MVSRMIAIASAFTSAAFSSRLANLPKISATIALMTILMPAIDCAAHVPDRKPISADALALLRYIRSCGLKELFKFSAGETVLRQVLGILQDFLEQHLEYQLKKGL